MKITTLSSSSFNQDIGCAKNAAKRGPVLITDRGRPAYALLTFDEYKKLAGGQIKIADLLAMPGTENLELKIPRLHDRPRSANLR
jgi:prevent-host-death family protein